MEISGTVVVGTGGKASWRQVGMRHIGLQRSNEIAGVTDR
jgi:hypothetical protein